MRGGAGGDGEELVGAEEALGKGLKLRRGGGADGGEEEIGELLPYPVEFEGKMTLDALEDAVDRAEIVALHILPDRVELVVGDGLATETVEFEEYLMESRLGALGSHIGRECEENVGAEDDGAAVDAVGVALVLADVGHET